LFQPNEKVFNSAASLLLLYQSVKMIFAARASGLQEELWCRTDGALHIQKCAMLPNGTDDKS
jgi:hypothetical protein